MFERYGEVVKCEVVLDPITRQSRYDIDATTRVFFASGVALSKSNCARWV